MNAGTSRFAAEIAARLAQDAARSDPGPLDRARRTMQQTGQWGPGQNMGRGWPIGCVALEVTQRCNLDCTACYLSESAEAIRDIPLEEVFRRIEAIASWYGRGTNVQITGGEATLRRREELLAIVRRACAAGLRPALFTNGIRATRPLLRDLCGAGLREVAFHVDTTQQLKGYASEVELNDLRKRYIERARGLPLAVYFNTTVHDGNFGEIPALVRFFVEHSDIVRIASFQLQAETGRGVMGRHGPCISLDTVTARIREGANARLDFDALQAGHARCNRYAMALVSNGKVYDALDDRRFVHWALDKTARLHLDRSSWKRSLPSVARWALSEPGNLATALAWLARKAWQMRRDLVASRARVHKLSFFVHDFMDACSLEPERIQACVFAVATAEGPVSMCQHNARRDEFLLKPVPMNQGQRIRFWNPLSGTLEDRVPPRLSPKPTRKTARGRARAALDARVAGKTTGRAHVAS